MVILLVIFWGGGVKNAGRGWRRLVFLLAFASPLAYLGLNVLDFPRGFADGWREAGVEYSAKNDEGHASAVQTPKPSHSQHPNPLDEWVSWSTLTLILMAVFHRLELHQSEAEHQTELAKEARSQVLAARLAPHFIFNALNTLHAQIEVDSKGAQATTERLADLFRQVVAVVAQPLIPLRQELAFVEAYLGIEQARLGDRLQVSIQVSEELESAQIPPLSLQVLVENAIKHGVGPLEQGGEVRIGAERKDGALHLWVEDPGPGVSAQRGTGTALDTLRQRLERPEDLVMGMVEGRHRVGFLWRQA
jgi:signal transduction histidine kinase